MTVPSFVVNKNGVSQLSADNLNTYIGGGAVVSSLRAFVGITGMEIGLVGFTTPNDGGQGFFYWNASGTAADDNGVTTIVPNGAASGCWTRLGSGTTSAIVNSVINADGSLTISPTNGNVVASLGSYSANTVLANATAGSAQPTGVSLSANNILGRGPSGNISALSLGSGLAISGTTLLAASPVIGSTRNALMSVTAPSATATFSADGVIVASALNGIFTLLPSFSQPVNLGTTGIGGMDIGSAPASGFVSLYAAWNGTSQGIFACNAVTTSTSSIYAGGNLPAGYTQTTLIGIWPTNASSQFPIGYQLDRTYWGQAISILSGGSAAGYTSTSLSTAVPPGAKTFGGFISTNTTGSTANIASDTNGTGSVQAVFIANVLMTFPPVAIITPRTTYYKVSTGTTSFSVNTYTF